MCLSRVDGNHEEDSRGEENGCAVAEGGGVAMGQSLASLKCLLKVTIGQRRVWDRSWAHIAWVAPTVRPKAASAIHRAMAIIIRFSVNETNPRGTLLDPPTQAHFSSRPSM